MSSFLLSYSFRMAWGAWSIQDPMNDQRTKALKHDSFLLVQDKRIQQWHGILKKEWKEGGKEREGDLYLSSGNVLFNSGIWVLGPENSFNNKISFIFHSSTKRNPVSDLLSELVTITKYKIFIKIYTFLRHKCSYKLIGVVSLI